MKTSFLIPCHNKHTVFIPNIINCLSASSVKPDEVLFSISNYENNNKLDDYFNEFKNLGLNIDFLIHRETKHAAQNRNILAKKAVGDILIFQDADDLFHPQRIEAINYCFNSFDVKHVSHCFSFINLKQKSQINFKNILLNNMNYFLLEKIYNEIFFDKLFSGFANGNYGCFDKKQKLIPQFPIHNGAISIKKEVFEEVQWKEDKKSFIIAEDQDFNYEVFYYFNKSLLLFEDLYFYNLSDRLNGGY